MSLHLLQKSLKLFEETDEYKKKRSKRLKKEAHKKKKQLKGVQNERKCCDDILKKIQLLDKLGADIPAQVTEKIFARTLKKEEKAAVEPKKEEESTIFTEEDFEKFEKEYNFD